MKWQKLNFLRYYFVNVSLGIIKTFSAVGIGICQKANVKLSPATIIKQTEHTIKIDLINISNYYDINKICR